MKTRNDIDKKFTEIVSSYLMDGWVINTESMNGHQGEEGKVDLIKGDELLRVWLSLEYDNERKDWYSRCMYLRVGKWSHPAKEAQRLTTIWMNELVTLEEIKYYRVSDTAYTEDYAEYVRIQEKKESRRENSFHYDATAISMNNNHARKIASEYLKRYAGYKRVSSNKIVITKKISRDFRISYNIEYNGRVYRLH